MDDFLNIIKTTSDRNFLLAVKYSNIMELVQERLDTLKKNQSPKVTEPLPAEVSLPATRDTPVKSASADTSSQKQALSNEHENDTTHAHHDYPDSVDMVPTAQKLREVLAKNDDKFTVVKLGADWCKPCVKVAPGFHELVWGNDNNDITYAVCDMTSRSKESAEVQEACGCQRIPYFAVFKSGVLLDGLQNSNIDTVKEFISTTVAENTMTDDMMFGDDF